MAIAGQPKYRLRCYENLQVESPKQVVEGLDGVAQQFSLDATDRLDVEI